MRTFGFSFSCTFNSTGGVEQFGKICHFVPKFLDDKLFEETEEYAIILDGIILNKKELFRKYHQVSWLDTMIAMYHDLGDEFFKVLCGSFAGVLFDKEKQKIIVFSDQIGSKFLYYTKVGDTFFFSTMMDDVYKYRLEKNANNTLSIENAYLLLSYGFMIDDRTLCEEIKKVRPGCYLNVNGGKIEEKQYFLLDNTPNWSLSESEWIDRIDETFRKAVKLQFEKDNEYGYKHLVALSAGLDSRMTCWVAHEMGYTDQLNFTFSQSNYYDETIPKKIASDLKHEWLFKALDNGLWLYNLDEITRLTGGNVLYYGLSHAYSMYSMMNFDEYGMIHSGQLGDVILGTWYESKDAKAQYKWGDGAYSRSMLNRISQMTHPDYGNQELTKFYLRGFSGTNNGIIAEYVFTEAYSPFLNQDFFNICLSIPVEYRFGHQIYKKWIIAKYPQAADYIWEKIGCKITRTLGIINIGGNSHKFENLPNKAIRKYFPNLLKPSVKSMNPLDYYMLYNTGLNEFLKSYTAFIDKICDVELKNDVLKLCLSKNGVERIQAASLLSALKMYF